MRPNLPPAVRILLPFCLAILAASSAFAQLSGAIFTTTGTGTTVNGNIYNAKTDVFLNGGPQNKQDPGLPDGTYYFQVTDPSGAVLLSADHISCRQVVVQNGRIIGVPGDSSFDSQPSGTPNACPDNGSGQTTMHALGTFNSNSNEVPVQLCPAASGRPNTLGNAVGVYDTSNMCDNTPNPGGEYKAWLTPIGSYVGPSGTCATGNNVFGFCDSASKTDNFKVKVANVAYITVCKFQACTLSDDDGTCGGTITDPLLSGWTIDATGADQGSEVTTSGFGQATPFGCATFTVGMPNGAAFTNGSATVTFNEVLQTGWQQTAPDIHTPGSAQCSSAGTVPNSDGSVVETCTVSPGDNIVAANFGNVMVAAGAAPTLVKTANGSFKTTYTWTVAKSVDKTQVLSAGGGPASVNYTVTVNHDGGTVSGVKVTGDITVSNPNPFPITLATVTDQLSDKTICNVDTSGGLTIAAATSTQVGTADYPYTCLLSAVPTGEEDNVALITWNDQSGTSNGVPFTLAAGSATFTFTNISFTNASIDNSVTVTDTLDGGTPSTLGTVTINADGTISVTGGVVDSVNPNQADFTIPQTFNDRAGTCTTHKNTATATTNSTTTPITSNEVDVTDCQGADLQVSKTATPSFTRTYNWTINKSVDKTRVETSATTATFSYTVVVSETGFTDSGWQVNGTITVSNPNDWEAVTVNVSDAINDGGTCVVTGGTNQSVPASGSISPTYTCTYSSAPSPAAFTNKATATWDKTAASTPDGSAYGTAGGAFGAPTNPVNKTITPTDSFNGGSGATLCSLDKTDSPNPCTLTAKDATPFTSQTYHYSRTVNNTTGGSCSSLTNTAITGTGSSSSQTVTVCNTATGGLTMGFWQNKNGQGIISGGGSTSGVCNSAPYLRTFAPFQDLSATAKCSDVATYVFNIIKAANAGGAAMNAMLKAQMLATALDVYFSTPQLGGNKTGAATPLGGVKIDLTQVCIMIDSSGGTGTCSGKNENTSAAFGGATSGTVNFLLTYAASQSNVGGSVWYGQNKTTQGLAKNTFDAINNQAAFIAP